METLFSLICCFSPLCLLPDGAVYLLLLSSQPTKPSFYQLSCYGHSTPSWNLPGHLMAYVGCSGIHRDPFLQECDHWGTQPTCNLHRAPSTPFRKFCFDSFLSPFLLDLFISQIFEQTLSPSKSLRKTDTCFFCQQFDMWFQGSERIGAISLDFIADWIWSLRRQGQS